MNKKRLATIEKEINKVISKSLYEDVKNKTLKKALISITNVRVTEDLKFADLSISIMPIKGENVSRDEILEALQNVKGYLRKKISDELALRYTPELRIKVDDTIEHAIKISKILDGLKD